MLVFIIKENCLGLDANEHAGNHQATLFEKGKWFKVHGKGIRTELHTIK
jgi:hypothetical protein